MKAIIIDDEKRARGVLAHLLKDHCPEVQVVAEAENAKEGLSCIQTYKPELVFLDIQMPGESGIVMLRKLDKIDFNLIFVTSYDNYAIEALRMSALDYLLKPVNTSDLKTAVSKAAKKNVFTNSAGLLKIVNAYEESAPEKFISAHHSGAVYMVKLSEIEFMESQGNYSLIVTGKNKFTVTKTLAELEQATSENLSFLRIHKSFVINLDHMVSYEKYEPYTVTMKSGKEIGISRRKKTEVLGILKNRIG